ncbi:hypothetical protein NP493_649g01057 [Ridgeia piscesae]|uniref:Sialate O-acetylesterase domain-containing protein n=1 Tax=Ridgeia piscesae TaxID=27915 RepID=A0AAD9KS62_RIDPI|nr:hypothetical protein NP493_649g01057 [Ridgeia piscesae]
MTVQDQCMSVEVAESKRNSDSTMGSEGTSEKPVEGNKKKEGKEQVAMNNITSIEMETGKKEDGDESDSDCAATETQPLKDRDEEGGVEDLDGDDSPDVFTKDCDSTSGKKGLWDKRCMTVGVVVLVLIVCGAIAAILMHRFTAREYHELQFASYYSDHMVLQRAPSRAVLWGYSSITDDNITITLQLKADSVNTVYKTSVHATDGNPVWRVVLDPVSDPGPFVITVTIDNQPGSTLQLTDVLFGDVWMCAGQSNMQYPVSMLSNSSAELANLEQFSTVRLFVVGSHKSPFSNYDLQKIQLPWSIPSKETLMGSYVPQGQFSSHFSALCWLYGKQLQQRLHYPIGLIEATYSSSNIDEWAPLNVLEDCGVAAGSTSAVWNAMVSPLLHLSLYGVIWYQGESDALALSRNYNCTFVKMVTSWRQKLYDGTNGATDLTFPFGFVQLGANRPGDHLTYGYTDIRWRQTANYGFVPNPHLQKVFMAVAMDLPDLNSTHRRQANVHTQKMKHTPFVTCSIHPRFKRVVASRLVKGALSVAYRQRNVTFAGPTPTKYAAFKHNHTLLLHLDSTQVDVRDKNGFEVCCSDDVNLFCPSSFIKTSYAPGREWVAAPVVAHSGHMVVLSWAACAANQHMVGLRYAWRETPCRYNQCAIYDATSSLPMPPYIHLGLLDTGITMILPRTQLNIL